MLLKYLSSLSHNTLRNCFFQHIPSNGIYSLKEIVDRITSKHFTQDAVISRYHSLPELQKNVLFHLILFNPKGRTEKDVRTGFKSYTSQEFEQAFLSLQKDFFITCMESEPSLFIIFPEFIEYLQPIIIRDIVDAWPRKTKPPLNTSGAFMPVWNDLVTLLIFCSKGKLKYTQKGFINKRGIDALSLNLQIKEDFKKVYDTGSFHADILPDRFRVLYSYAIDRELIHYGENSLEISESGISWIQLPVENKIDDFLSYALKSYVFPEEKLQTLISILRNLESWTDIKQLLSFHYESGKNGELLQTKNNIKKFSDFPLFYRILCYAGLVELAYGFTRGKPFLKTTALGRLYWNSVQDKINYTSPVFVTPNFELIVPHELSHWKRFQISSLCTCESFDQVYRLRITRYSIHEALKNCFSSKEAENILQSIAKEMEISENILSSVRNWIKEFGRISFSQPFILITENQKLIDELKSIPAIARFLKKEITDYGFIIEKENYKDIFSALVHAGYYPRPLNTLKNIINTNTEFKPLEFNQLLITKDKTEKSL